MLVEARERMFDASSISWSLTPRVTCTFTALTETFCSEGASGDASILNGGGSGGAEPGVEVDIGCDLRRKSVTSRSWNNSIDAVLRIEMHLGKDLQWPKYTSSLEILGYLFSHFDEVSIRHGRSILEMWGRVIILIVSIPCV